MKTFKIIGSTNPESLKNEKPHITVEAAYGSILVEGSVATMDHHVMKNDSSVCDQTIEIEKTKKVIQQCPDKEIIIGVSHLDLDAMICIIKIMNLIENDAGLSYYIGQLDTKGPHRLSEIVQADPNTESQETLKKQINSLWAWTTENKSSLMLPRDGSVIDVTEQIYRFADVYKKVVLGDPELIHKGEEFLKENETLEKDSFIFYHSNVLVRSSDKFVNHLYEHDNHIYDFVIGYNTERKSYTLSKENPEIPGNCAEIMKAIFGSEAGGHIGIAGSPRDQEYQFDRQLIYKIIAEINK